MFFFRVRFLVGCETLIYKCPHITTSCLVLCIRSIIFWLKQVSGRT